MSSFLDTMLERAKADKQTIVLPEGDDPRTLEAAETILAQGVANLIILGNVAAIKESGRALDGATLIDPQDSDLHDEFANTLYELRKHKGMTLEQAAEKVRDVLFFGVLIPINGYEFFAFLILLVLCAMTFVELLALLISSKYGECSRW